MGLLGRIKQLISENEKPAEVTRVMAPLSGEIVPLDTVPDAVFAGKIVGMVLLSVLPAAFIFPAHVLRRHLIIREVAASPDRRCVCPRCPAPECGLVSNSSRNHGYGDV
ncbi:hypothetical protein O5551_10375 [Escherichia coli]|nr:hypothetical protein [Escherichia coli]MCZ5505679.1 hypothetical protein [Escherichia coli]